MKIFSFGFIRSFSKRKKHTQIFVRFGQVSFSVFFVTSNSAEISILSFFFVFSIVCMCRVLFFSIQENLDDIDNT